MGKNGNKKSGCSSGCLTVFAILFIIGLIVNGIDSCSNRVGRAIKASNTVGDWYYENSKKMGGYRITAKTKLTIIRNSSSDYGYRVSTTWIDKMSGGQPETEHSSGGFEEKVKYNKWRFRGGDFGSRGGYIEVPKDNWDDYKPSTITVHFASGRGYSMTFRRY